MDLFGFKRRKKEKEIIEKMDALQIAINEQAEKALEKVKEEWLEKIDKLKGNNIQTEEKTHTSNTVEYRLNKEETESLTKQSYILQCEMGESPATLEIHPECGKLWTDRMVDVALSVSENKIMVTKEEELSYCKISNMEEFEGVFAYRLEKRHNRKVYSVAQGVTDRKSLDNYEKTGEFENLFEYYLTNTKRLHEILSKPNDYRFGGQNIYGDCFIVSPYDSGIVIDETGEYCLIKNTINQECRVEDYLETYHPVGIIFDKNTGINDLNYDLSAMLNVIKVRNDVEFNLGEHILHIPSFGQREFYGKPMFELRFVWIPSKEDLEMALDGDMFSHKLAVKNVFGVMEKYEHLKYR